MFCIILSIQKILDTEYNHYHCSIQMFLKKLKIDENNLLVVIL